MNGFCRLYGIPFHPQVWTEVNHTIVNRVSGSDGWEVEGEEVEVVEEIAEVIEETIEETDESLDLSSLTKSELKDLCDDQGIDYKSLDTKTTLLGLLQSDEE